MLSHGRRPIGTARPPDPVRVVAVLLAVLAGWLAPSPVAETQASAPPRQVKIGVAVQILAFAPLAIAEVKGYFKDQGVEVTTISLRGGTATTQTLIGGSIQFAASAAPDVIRADQKGLDVIAIANILTANDVELTISRKLQQQLKISRGTPLRERLMPLRGRLFGVTSIGSASQINLQALFKSIGLAPDSLRFIAIGGAAELSAALRADRIAGYLVGPPAGELADREGFGYVLVPVGEAAAFADQAFTDIFTTRAYTRGNPELVRSVAGAIARANDFLLDHPAEAARLIAPSYKGVPLDLLTESLRKLPFARGARFSPTGWQNAIRALKDAGVLEGQLPSADPEVLWTNQYLP